MRVITQIPATFAMQSYFDDALGERAVLSQTVGSPIVPTTLRTVQSRGIGFALHPASETPIAAHARGTEIDTGTVVLAPGQKVITGPFDEFEWGLPFGWLGGGTALLYVIHEKNADVGFSAAHVPLVFQRTRILVTAAAGTARKNWPSTFPSANVAQGANAAPQGGGPLLRVDPDVALLRYNIAAPGAAVPVTLVVYNCDPFDRGLAGALANRSVEIPLTFPASTVAVPVVELPAEFHRLAGPDAVVSIVGAGVGVAVDVVRYGRLM